MKTYLRLFSFARPIGSYTIPYFIFTIMYAIFNTFNFVLIIPLLNTLFSNTESVIHVTQMPEIELNMAFFEKFLNFSLYKIFGTEYTIMSVLLFLAVFIASSCFLSNLFRYLGQRKIEFLRIATLQKIRDSVYDNVLELDAGYFSEQRKGDIIAKITSDVQVVQFCITNTLQVAFREPFLIIGYMFALINISWQLTVFAIIFLPITAIVIGFIVKRLRASAREAQERFSDMVTTLDESLTGIKVISAYGAKGYVANKFHQINASFSSIARSMARRQQLASPTSEFLGISAAALLMIYAGKLVIAGELNVGEFMAYLAIFSQITRPIRSFVDSFATIHQGIAAGERVLALLDTKSQITDAPDAKPLDTFSDKIEFRDVRFSYEEKEIIKGVNFTINKGETVALVGPSGGGKSTLSDLIPRFYDPQQGSVEIDGKNIKSYQIESLRAQIALVAQETILFNDTIENNIRLGNTTASIEEVMHAAKIANAHNFIMEKEQGYQTIVGDRGMKLSGGQRQRLSIARAILKNPPILILDEATSALDTESEKLVQLALDTLLEGRTSIVIAHRLSTINNADKILVVDKGIIAEQGTHEELMAKKGIYYRLIEMQQLNS